MEITKVLTFVWKLLPKCKGGEPRFIGEDTERRRRAAFCCSTKHAGGKTTARGLKVTPCVTQQEQRKARSTGHTLLSSKTADRWKRWVATQPEKKRRWKTLFI